MPPKKRGAPVEKAAEATNDTDKAEDVTASGDDTPPAKKGRGRPKGTFKAGGPVAKAPKSGRGRGRPPLSAEEKAKRQAEREAGKAAKTKSGKPVGRPRKSKK